MKPQFPIPTQPLLFKHIVESTLIEREEISEWEVQKTFNREAINPSAAGHFSAIKYGVELAQTSDFPAKHPIQWESPSKADINLYWIHELHKKLMTPTAEYGEYMMNKDFIQKADCGPYRLNERHMTTTDVNGNIYGRPLPKPTDIPKLMQLWYRGIGEFHLKHSAVLSRPTTQNLLDIEAMTWKIHLQLQCIHPWVDGTGRSARLIENIFRLRWGLPWKIIQSKDKLDYIAKIMTYEDSPEWQDILASLSK